MNDHRESGFKSYLDESCLETIKLNDAQQTKLLDGETTVYTATNVLLFTPISDRKKGIYGHLTITTFKLSFASATDENEKYHQHNLLLGRNEVCLQAIANVYQVGERTKKKLIPGQNVTGKIKELLITCKNMRSFEFSFKDSEKDSGKNIANALLHHAYPKRHSLLFAYENREPYVMSPQVTKEVTFYRTKADWERELKRSRCKNWRLSDANLNYEFSQYLNQTIIVPSSVEDVLIKRAAEHFNNSFCPVWVWGTARGAALVRMADLMPTITESSHENQLLEHIRRSHPELRAPSIINLNSPSAKELQSGYAKLRDLCIPDNSRTFRNQDRKFYALLDNSKWLAHVSTYLSKAEEAARLIYNNNTTVVLQEGNGQDANCVVSSLTQIILEPHFRRRQGFQSLIQKEWVALGHPFSHRLGLVANKEVEPAPYFLVFLDCVWQLQQQHPAAFDFSETYLTTLWDSCHVSIFDTFLFNNEHERMMAESGTNTGASKLVLRSTWDWREQFQEQDLMLFHNPLYDDSYRQVLSIKTGLSALEIWNQCYFRWLPELEIRNGGKPVVDMFNRVLVSNICILQQGEKDVFVKNRDNNLELLSQVNSFFPFSNNLESLPISTNNIFFTNDGLESQSVYNMNTTE